MLNRHLKGNERHWEELTDRILRGDVIPIIGPEFLAANAIPLDNPDKPNYDEINGWVNPQTAIIELLKEECEIKDDITSFSELLWHEKFPEDCKRAIHEIIKALLDPNREEVRFIPSVLLVKLIRVCQFRFVITTSFMPLIEEAMEQVWGKGNVRVMNFSNDPERTDDLMEKDDIQIPTVYHMFGALDARTGSYAVTDSDILAFCRAWLTRPPKTLAGVLGGKYLLMLGNNYSDWLCRFVWFSLKSELNKKPNGMLVDSNGDDSLMQFMHRIDAFTHQNPEIVVSELEKRVEKERKIREAKKFKATPTEEIDVFISYSRRDREVVEKLYDLLSKKKLRVWYDRECLGGGDDFMLTIYEAIKKSRLFVPLLTKNITKEADDQHVYRAEWNAGIEKRKGLARNFIWPICEYDFDFYSSDIPEGLKRYNAREYKNDNDLSKHADEIYEYLMKIS
ncbi:MAG: toll/interleukin-1 receptor domain-containing protein [Prevotella sp.]|nr:toll/interleukin-1 receptor domain-containing protein [Prevotella sp.]